MGGAQKMTGNLAAAAEEDEDEDDQKAAEKFARMICVLSFRMGGCNRYDRVCRYLCNSDLDPDDVTESQKKQLRESVQKVKGKYVLNSDRLVKFGVFREHLSASLLKANPDFPERPQEEASQSSSRSSSGSTSASRSTGKSQMAAAAAADGQDVQSVVDSSADGVESLMSDLTSCATITAKTPDTPMRVYSSMSYREAGDLLAKASRAESDYLAYILDKDETLYCNYVERSFVGAYSDVIS